MKKFVSLLLAVVLCLSFGATAFAAEPVTQKVVDEIPYSEGKLVIPDGEPTYFDIPEQDDIPLEELPDEGEVSVFNTRAFLNTANEFKLLFLEVHPVVMIDGKPKALDASKTFEPSIYAPTVIKGQMTLQEQQVLITRATTDGKEVVGWYLTGRTYMNCYIPYRVEYRVYNHEYNGEVTKGKAVRKGSGTADIYEYCLYPSDMTKDYTYGFDGRGVMQIYDKVNNTAPYVYPEYSMKVTFKNN